MPARVPVLGDHHVAKPRPQAVDQRHQRIAFGYRQLPTGHEVILHVDDQQCAVTVGGVDAEGHGRVPWYGPMCCSSEQAMWARACSRRLWVRHYKPVSPISIPLWRKRWLDQTLILAQRGNHAA